MRKWLSNYIRGVKALFVKILTNMSVRTPKSVHRIPGSHVLIRKLVVVWVHRRAPGASRFLRQAVHLQKYELPVITYYLVN
jgi:hypothetical protein